MQTIALVIHVFLAIGVIGLVLIQHGKGAEAGQRLVVVLPIPFSGRVVRARF